MHALYVYEHGKRLSARVQRHNPDSKLAQALQAGQPTVLGDRASMDAFGIKTVPGTDTSLSLVFVPVLVGERLIASVSLESFEREHAFGESEVALLSTIASSMGVALENARLLEATQRSEREAAALAEVGRDLSSSLDLATVMDRIAGHARNLLQANSSAIFLPDERGTAYRAIVAIGDMAQALKATTIEGGKGIIGSLVQSGKAEFINDATADPRAVQIEGTERITDERLMVVPLLGREDAVKGAMAIWRTGGQPFDPRDLEFLQGLSQQATVALNNARHFKESQDALGQQTATADILRVISASPTDTQPVFDAIVRTAVSLLGCDLVSFVRVEGDHYLAVAHATQAGRAEFTYNDPVPIDPAQNFPSQAIAWKRTVHHPRLGCDRAPAPAEDDPRRAQRARLARRSAAAQRRGDRRVDAVPRASGWLQCQGDRAGRVVPRPGAHRDPEHHALQGDAGGAGAADRHRRYPAGDQRIALERTAGVRRHRRNGAPPARLRLRVHDPHGWQDVHPHGGPSRRHAVGDDGRRSPGRCRRLVPVARDPDQASPAPARLVRNRTARDGRSRSQPRAA